MANTTVTGSPMNLNEYVNLTHSATRLKVKRQGQEVTTDERYHEIVGRTAYRVGLRILTSFWKSQSYWLPHRITFSVAIASILTN